MRSKIIIILSLCIVIGTVCSMTGCTSNENSVSPTSTSSPKQSSSMSELSITDVRELPDRIIIEAKQPSADGTGAAWYTLKLMQIDDGTYDVTAFVHEGKTDGSIGLTADTEMGTANISQQDANSFIQAAKNNNVEAFKTMYEQITSSYRIQTTSSPENTQFSLTVGEVVTQSEDSFSVDAILYDNVNRKTYYRNITCIDQDDGTYRIVSSEGTTPENTDMVDIGSIILTNEQTLEYLRGIEGTDGSDVFEKLWDLTENRPKNIYRSTQ